jgi:hypothetical protein
MIIPSRVQTQTRIVRRAVGGKFETYFRETALMTNAAPECEKRLNF